MIGVRVSDELLEQIDQAAERFNTSRAGLAVMGLELMAGFGPDFFRQIEAAARSLGVPTWLFVQNKMIKMMALDAAEREIRPDEQRILLEFRYTNAGPMTGDELFHDLKAKYLDIMIQEELDKLIRIKLEGGFLHPDEEKFLEKYADK